MTESIPDAVPVMVHVALPGRSPHITTQVHLHEAAKDLLSLARRLDPHGCPDGWFHGALCALECLAFAGLPPEGLLGRVVNLAADELDIESWGGEIQPHEEIAMMREMRELGL